MDGEHENSNGSSGCFGFIILLVIIWVIFSFFNNSENSNTYKSGYSNEYSNEETILSREEAIEDYWDNINDYLTGTAEVEACYDYSNCYTLEADISSGTLEKLYFPNTGYLNFSADFDSNGEASDYDEDDRSWDFTLDMFSSVVDDAIDEWADSEGYTID